MSTVEKITLPPTEPTLMSNYSSTLDTGSDGALRENDPHWHNGTLHYTQLEAYWQAQIIRLVLLPFIIFFGTIGNLISIHVLRKKILRAMTTFYLIVLEVIDTIVIILVVLPKWIGVLRGINPRRVSNFTCKTYSFVVYFTTDYSSWVLVLVSLERAMSVVCAASFTKTCKMSVAKASLVVIGVLLGGINCIFFITHSLDPTTTLCAPAGKLKSFYLHVFVWIDLCFYSILPSVLMFISNIVLLTTIRNQAAKVQSTATKNQSQVTLILMAVNTMFIINTLPTVLFNPIVDADWYVSSPYRRAMLELVKAPFEILMYNNHAVNFVMYIVAGGKFRDDVKKIFCRSSRVGALAPNAPVVNLD